MALREQSGLRNKVLSEAFAMRRLLHGQGLHGCVKVYCLRTLYALPCVLWAVPFHTHCRLVCLPTSSLG